MGFILLTLASFVLVSCSQDKTTNIYYTESAAPIGADDQSTPPDKEPSQQVAERTTDGPCDPMDLIKGCQFPKPVGYPSDGNPTYTGIFEQNICDQYTLQYGPQYIKLNDACVRFDAVQAYALGFYAQFGYEYYRAFPLIEGPLCKTEIDVGIKTRICFYP
ncbi:MAG: hypothetical protein AB7F86_13070 [Bdellovibrionales bacterium]